MGWDGLERRQHPRAKIRLMVELEAGREGGPQARTRLQTLNFGAGGFYCHVNRKMEPLTRLGLRFVFPPFGPEHGAERTIQCEAIVVRCDRQRTAEGDYRIAAHLMRLGEGDRRYLDDYVAWYNEVYAEADEDPCEDEREAA